jgi:dihydrofolate reductase
MRRLIAGMKISVDGKIEGPEGYADWVDAWSEDYGLTAHIDACLLGGRMYPGYEHYWSAIQDAPDHALPMTGRLATPDELKWARFAAQTPHYVFSNTLGSAAWPKTRFLRKVGDIAALKDKPGKDIYLMGGSRITASLIDAGLVDELRLITCPLIAGPGKSLFDATTRRHALVLRNVMQIEGGRVCLSYDIKQGPDRPATAKATESGPMQMPS